MVDINIVKLIFFHICILEGLTQYDENFWEQSGKFEGDIDIDMVDVRNGLKDTKHRWPNGIVPYEIEKDDFSDEEIDEIKNVIKYYHNETCIQFKKRDDTDDAWLTFRGDNEGCYSSVGRKGDGGQTINLKPPKCVRKGIITHEMLHALGFFHQQSSTERDDYVTILWDNIEDGKEHNFLKYNASTVTNFGYEYDYQSVMHYSGKAFSKNGENTIVAKNENTTLGQRKGFSELDLTKLKAMYSDECKKRQKDASLVEDINSLWTMITKH
ncbi:zinc metalloproteinase nas-15-like [Chrysoperla carnea]|uniref:zinc metalloproteinase nas-15-like n=1 Tax=Chrysoperla carnea TaxID=189513 RepID=UPI001D05FDD7|nr:zinc metalloproteinase nas-15-like [Chrysoperla carnea]